MALFVAEGHADHCNFPLPFPAARVGAMPNPVDVSLVRGAYSPDFRKIIKFTEKVAPRDRHWPLPCFYTGSFRAGGIPTHIGDQVRFRAVSVFLWPEQSSLTTVPEDAEIEGKVIAFSDSGPEPRAFAVVEVVKTETVIVPVGDLEVIEP